MQCNANALIVVFSTESVKNWKKNDIGHTFVCCNIIRNFFCDGTQLVNYDLYTGYRLGYVRVSIQKMFLWHVEREKKIVTFAYILNISYVNCTLLLKFTSSTRDWNNKFE